MTSLSVHEDLASGSGVPMSSFRSITRVMLIASFRTNGVATYRDPLPHLRLTEPMTTACDWWQSCLKHAVFIEPSADLRGSRIHLCGLAFEIMGRVRNVDPLPVRVSDVGRQQLSVRRE